MSKSSAKFVKQGSGLLDNYLLRMVLTLVVLIMNVYSSYNIYKMYNEKVSSDDLFHLKYELVGQGAEALIALRATNLAHVTALDAESKAQIEKDRAVIIEGLGNLYSRFEALPLSPKEREAIADFRRKADSFVAVTEVTIGFSRKGNIKDAMAWAQNEGNAAYKSALESADQFKKVFKKEAALQREEHKRHFNHAMLANLVVVGLMVLLFIYLNVEILQFRVARKKRKKGEKKTNAPDLYDSVSSTIFMPIVKAKQKIRYLNEDVMKGYSPSRANILEATSVALENLNEIDEVLSNLLILSDQRPLRMTPVYIDQLLERVKERLVRRAFINGQGIMVDVDEKVPVMFGDPVLLERAITGAVMQALQDKVPGQWMVLRAKAGKNRNVVITVQGDLEQVGDQTRVGRIVKKDNRNGNILEAPVTEKIIDMHNGKLELKHGEDGLILELSMPIHEPESNVDEDLNLVEK